MYMSAKEKIERRLPVFCRRAARAGGAGGLITQRQSFILKSICDAYARTGEPVGSKAIAALPGISMSSATIRAEMAALEKYGFLTHPHTSAGRVPTSLGYRFYIDHLMERDELSADEQQQIAQFLTHGLPDPDSILQRAGNLLAYLTQYATLATSPQMQDICFQKIELLLLSPTTLAIVAMTGGGLVLNRVCRLEEPADADALVVLENFVRRNVLDRPVGEIVPAHLQGEMLAVLAACPVLKPVLAQLIGLCQELCSVKVQVQGQTNLLRYARQDTDFFTFLDLLQQRARRDQSPAPRQIAITMGDDLGANLSGIAFVSTPYRSGGGESGVLGVIGPSYLNYSKIIPHIEYFTALLGNILSGADSEGDQ